jgi:hypothetical protein
MTSALTVCSPPSEEAGLAYVEDRCLKVDHARLLGRSPGRQAAG